MASYYKRGDTWTVQFRLDGRQVKRGGFKTKREAEREYYDIVHTKEKQVLSGYKVKDIAPIFLSDKQARVKDRTQKTYRLAISYFVEKLGNKAIDKITVEDIERLERELLSTLTHGTVGTYLTNCNSFIKFAIRKGYATKNAFDNFERIKDKSIKQVRVWSESEFKEFINHCDKYKELYIFLYLTGCRIGEALALTWSDIDLEKKIVRISKTIGMKGEHTTPKTKSSNRTVWLPNYLVEMLSSMDKKDKVFNTSYSTAQRHFYKTIEKTTLPRITLHDLRHSHASLLISKGQNILVVAQRLGHTDISMTLNTYSHLLPNAQEQFTKALDFKL